MTRRWGPTWHFPFTWVPHSKHGDQMSTLCQTFFYQYLLDIISLWNAFLRLSVLRMYSRMFKDPKRIAHIVFIRSYHFWSEVVHYSDVIMSTMASQITGVSILCSAVCSGSAERKHQSSVSLAFVRWIHQWPPRGFPSQRASNVEKGSIMSCSWMTVLRYRRS